jgi:hypothetical protein
MLSSRLTKSVDDSAEFNRALAKSLIATGAVLRATHERLDGIEKSLDAVLDGPAREPLAVTTDKPISKALDRPLGGQTADTSKQMPTYDRAKLGKVLEQMHKDSILKGGQGVSASGLSIKDELAKALTNCPIDPRILQDAQDFQKARGN